MLKPAILYKDELERKFAEYLYTDDYFWYAGYGTCNELPKIENKDEHYQWAIVNSENRVIGYLAYRIQITTDTVLNFGLFSFERGNPLIGIELSNKLQELVNEHRRIEWRMIGGNPVKKHYDNFCKKNNGNCVCLHDVTQDIHGNWHDEYIYEILKNCDSDRRQMFLFDEEQEQLDFVQTYESIPCTVKMSGGEYVSRQSAVNDITRGLCVGIKCVKCPFNDVDDKCKVREWLMQLTDKRGE